MQGSPDNWHPERWGVLAGLMLALITIWQKTKAFRARVWWLITRPWKLTESDIEHTREIRDLKRRVDNNERQISFLQDKEKLEREARELRRRLERDQ